MEEVNQIQRAALAWNVLIDIAENRKFIQYKELGDQIGIHHRVVRIVLAVIQKYCLENHLPPITILVGDEDGVPGTGFIAWDILNLEYGKNQVYDYNWKLLENPFVYALDGITEDEVVTSLLNNPESSEDVYARVKVRGTAQTLFRKALLKAYKSRCAMCGLSFEFALQAAHIVSWNKSTHAQRLDVRNGILLCANHHYLFDNGIIFVNEQYIIQVNNKTKIKTDSDRIIVTAVNNIKLNLPKDNRLHPNVEYLKSHNKHLK